MNPKGLGIQLRAHGEPDPGEHREHLYRDLRRLCPALRPHRD